MPSTSRLSHLYKLCTSRGRQRVMVRCNRKINEMIQGQKRAKETKKEATSPHSFWLRYMCFSLDAQKLAPTDKASSGLFLTQMNSKSTKALGCFLRILVEEVADLVFLLLTTSFLLKIGAGRFKKHATQSSLLWCCYIKQTQTISRGVL